MVYSRSEQINILEGSGMYVLGFAGHSLGTERETAVYKWKHGLTAKDSRDKTVYSSIM